VLLRYYALVVVMCVLFTPTSSSFSSLPVRRLNTVTWADGVCAALRLCGPPYCTRWYVFSTGSLQAVAGLQQFLMASRVYALYRRSRRIYHTLLWAFVVEHIAILIFTVATASTVRWSGLCVADSVSMLSVGIG
jgi:hypothetical protein